MFLQSVATMVRPDPMLIAPIRDPNDIVVLQTAIIGGAEAICTTDEDFFNPPATAFLQSVNTCKAAREWECLQRVHNGLSLLGRYEFIQRRTAAEL